jgi:hypothetical protein
VGIFWWWRSRLLAESVVVAAGVAFNGGVHGGRDHVKVWPRFQRRYPVLIDTDYIDIPRGRVLYLQSAHQFIVYLDRKLATPKVKAAVLAAFALPRRGTKFEFDPHYTTDQAALELMFGGG